MADQTLTPAYRHEPVMLEEVLSSLALKPGSTVCDCTLGGAGHSVRMAAEVGEEGLLIGIDQDDMALAAASQRLDREAPCVPHKLLKGNFGNLDELLCSAEVPGVDGFLFDLGVSSPQLDIPGRGFSYHEDAPLDMRMNPEDHTLTAAEVINTYRQVFGGSGVLAGCVEHTTSDFLIYGVAALRPVLISKHIQIRPADNPGDYHISVDTANLAAMVKKVRYIEQALGGGSNQFVLGADGGASAWTLSRRKVLVAARNIPAGKRVEEADLTAKRPGNLGGVSPMQYIHLIGSVAKRDIRANEPLEFEFFSEIQSAPYKYPPLDEYRTSADLNSIRGA